MKRRMATKRHKEARKGKREIGQDEQDLQDGKIPLIMLILSKK